MYGLGVAEATRDADARHEVAVAVLARRACHLSLRLARGEDGVRRTAEEHVTSLIDQSRRTGRPGLTTRTARRFQPVA